MSSLAAANSSLPKGSRPVTMKVHVVGHQREHGSRSPALLAAIQVVDKLAYCTFVFGHSASLIACITALPSIMK